MVYAAFASLKYRLSPLATRTVGIASLKELIDSFENVRTIPADSKAEMMFSLVELCRRLILCAERNMLVR